MLTVVSFKVSSIGDKYLSRFTVDLDNSYPTGGYSLVPKQVGLSGTALFPTKGDAFIVSAQYGGFIYEYNYTTQKLIVYAAADGTLSANSTFTGVALAPHSHNIQVTQDETIAVTAGTGVSAALANIPVGTIDNVFIAAGGVTGVAELVPVGSVANSKEVSANYTTGVLQFLVADAVTSAIVTYARAAVSSTSGGTPAGSVTTTIAGASAFSEVANGTDLSTLTGLEFMMLGQ